MKNLIYLIAISTGILLSSCSKNLTYFTSDLVENYNWGERELKRIQFYVSEDIYLYKTEKGGSSQIKGGRIEIKDQRKVDEIIIKEGTPGILMFMPKENTFAISFDDSGNHLIFSPGKKTNGKYTLRAKKWLERRKGGVISYGDEEYYTTTQSAYAALMVDLNKANKSERKSERASGRTVR